MYCCNEMKQHINAKEIPIIFTNHLREYGIKVLDGGTSIQIINYCPWCGKELPSSLRDKWFNEMEKLSIDIFNDDIPSIYLSSKWWQDGKK